MTSLSSIALPSDIQWLDEFEWSATNQSVSRTVGGRMIVQYGEIYAGRPVTIKCHWLDKSTLDQLIVLRDTPGAVMPLVLADGRSISVMFRHQESSPTKATPVIDYAEYEGADLFDVTLKLMEI